MVIFVLELVRIGERGSSDAYVEERVEIDTVCMNAGALLDVESPCGCSRIIGRIRQARADSERRRCSGDRLIVRGLGLRVITMSILRWAK